MKSTEIDYDLQSNEEDFFLTKHLESWHTIERKIKTIYKYKTNKDTLEIDSFLDEVNFWDRLEKSIISYLQTGKSYFYLEFYSYFKTIIESEKEEQIHTGKMNLLIKNTLLNNDASSLEDKYAKFLDLEDFKITEENFEEFMKYFGKYCIDRITKINNECVKETGNEFNVKTQMKKDLTNIEIKD